MSGSGEREDSRVARSRKAILDATAQLVAESGFSGFSMDDVAERAGVGKATIYRHWRSRAELVMDTSAALSDPMPSPDSGEVRTDLIELLTALQRALTSPTTGPVIVALIDAAERDPELRRLRDAAVRQRRQVCHGVLRRAVERGDLPEGTDVELTSELLVAPIFHRRLITRSRIDRDFIVTLVDTVLRATSVMARSEVDALVPD